MVTVSCGEGVGRMRNGELLQRSLKASGACSVLFWQFGFATAAVTQSRPPRRSRVLLDVMLGLRAFRPRLHPPCTFRHSPKPAFMSGLPGMSPGATIDPAPPTSSSSNAAFVSDQAATAAKFMQATFGNSDDPALRALPPVGTAYPRQAPPKANVHAVARGEQNEADITRYYGLHVKSTRNNTIVTVSNPVGEKLKTYSGGTCGFKGHRRSGYEAGYQCAVKAIEYLKETLPRDMKDVTGRVASPTMTRVKLYLNGFGQGRDAMQKALISAEGEDVRKKIKYVSDVTAMKIGGTRAKKRRRL